MPPRAKGARLWLRPERRSASGKLISKALWNILDAGRHIATGYAASELQMLKLNSLSTSPPNTGHGAKNGTSRKSKSPTC
jgi:hypothetical protein